MIDFAKFALSNHDLWPGETSQPFLHKGIRFVPYYNATTGTLTMFKGRIKNLEVQIRRKGVVLANSLHKYEHGNNYGDFTFSEFANAIEEINELTGLDWKKAAVKKLEYACNLQDVSTVEINQGLICYSQKPFIPMEWSGTQYGVGCQLDCFKLKSYDKQLETLIHDHKSTPTPIYRWEIATTNMKHLQKRNSKIPIFKVEDLLDQENLELLAEDLSSKFRRIVKRQDLSHISTLSLTDKKVIAYMQNDQVREAIKAHHYETYRKDLNRYKRICSENEDLYEEVANKIYEKCQQLIYS